MWYFPLSCYYYLWGTETTHKAWQCLESYLDVYGSPACIWCSAAGGTAVWPLSPGDVREGRCYWNHDASYLQIYSYPPSNQGGNGFNCYPSIPAFFFTALQFIHLIVCPRYLSGGDVGTDRSSTQPLLTPITLAQVERMLPVPIKMAELHLTWTNCPPHPTYDAIITS